MPMNNVLDIKFTHNAVGFEIAGGATERILEVNGTGDITLTGDNSGHTFTMPSATTTLVGTDTTQTLSSKTLGKTIMTPGSTIPAFSFSSSGSVTTNAAGDLWWDGSQMKIGTGSNTSKRLLHKRSALITLMTAFTPTGTGVDPAVVVVPHDPADGTTSVTWNVKAVYLHCLTASANTLSINISKYTGTGAFSGSNLLASDLSLTSSAYQNTQNPSTTTAASGDKLSVNITAYTAASQANVTVQLLLEES